MEMVGLLKLGLLACVVIYSIVSVVKYKSRRSDNKHAFRDLAANGKAIRRLGVEEQAALKPFLGGGDAGVDVYGLQGAFVRHGLESNHGAAATMHDTLGGVDVILPYDARDFLASHNQAEVVLGKKFAVVVALNGEFDLIGARERSLRLQQQERQWTSGKPGEIKEIYSSAEAGPEAAPGATASAFGGAAASAASPGNHAEILGQRDETPAEVAARSGRGVGMVPALLWILAFGALAFAASDVFGDGWVYAAGAAAICALLALWLFWRARRLPPAQRVNRVRGRLSEIVLHNADNSAIVSRQYFIGDEFAVAIPAQWKSQLAVPDDAQVDVDVRVADRSVVRFGKTHSVDEETRRFPRIFWGRHFTVAFVALCALLAVCLTEGTGLASDMALTVAWARGMQPQSYESAAALAAASPAWGALLTVRGRARCEVRDYGYGARLVCNRLRWEGETPKSADLGLDSDMLALYSGEFIDARSNPVLDMMLQNQLSMQSGVNPLARVYASRNKVMVIPHVSALVGVVRKACEAKVEDDGDWPRRCAELEASVVRGVKLNSDEEPADWGALVKLADTGKLKKDDKAVLTSSSLEQIKTDARSLVEPRFSAALEKTAQVTLKSQRGGVVLQVRPGPHTVLPEMQGGEEQEDGRMAEWRVYQALATPASLRDFNITGIVVDVGHDASGAPRFQVDASRSVDQPRGPALYSLWAVLALVLALVHATLFVLRFLAARRMNRERDAAYKQRTTSAFF
jgi:hypothetical protein